MQAEVKVTTDKKILKFPKYMIAYNGMVILAMGEGRDPLCYEATCIYDPNSPSIAGEHSDDYAKSEFKDFRGNLEIKQ